VIEVQEFDRRDASTGDHENRTGLDNDPRRFVRFQLGMDGRSFEPRTSGAFGGRLGAAPVGSRVAGIWTLSRRPAARNNPSLRALDLVAKRARSRREVRAEIADVEFLTRVGGAWWETAGVAKVVSPACRISDGRSSMGEGLPVIAMKKTRSLVY